MAYRDQKRRVRALALGLQGRDMRIEQLERELDFLRASLEGSRLADEPRPWCATGAPVWITRPTAWHCLGPVRYLRSMWRKGETGDEYDRLELLLRDPEMYAHVYRKEDAR